jgi:hypothetical protein
VSVLQLETAATAGVVLVIGLIVLLAVDAIDSRFPAIQDGSLPLWSLKVDGHLPEAFSVVGYAFYMQVQTAAVGQACRMPTPLCFQDSHCACMVCAEHEICGINSNSKAGLQLAVNPDQH